MPKPRRANQSDTWLGVGVWQHKKAASPQDDAAHAREKGYAVVELSLEQEGGAQEGMQVEQTAAQAARAAPGSGPTAVPPAPREWQAKKRRKPADEQPAAAAEEGASAAAAGQEDEADELQAGAASQPSSTSISGLAYLACFPNASITGHVVADAAAGGGRKTWGLVGEQVISRRECTRDEEWGVVRLSLMDFAGGASGGRPVATFLTERSGGDAAVLRAPVEWQGTEEEERQSLEVGCSAVHMSFRCDQLMAGDAAEALLRRLQPSLCGRGALVNVGAVELQLPEPEARAPAAGASRSAGLASRQLLGGRSDATGRKQRLLTLDASPSARAVADDQDW